MRRHLVRLGTVVVLLAGSAAGGDAGAGDFTLEFHLEGTLAENPAPAVDCGPNGNWILGNIVFDRDRGPGGREWGISLGAGRVTFGVTNASRVSATFCGTTNVLDGDWHHVAVQRRAADGLVQIWVDGALDLSATGPPGDVAFPGDAVPSFPPFSGRIDGVRVSPGLRYAAPFVPPAAPGAAFPAEGEVRIEAYPNPARGETLLWVSFGDGRGGDVTVDIHDGVGRRVADVRGALRAGAGMVVWDGTAADGTPLGPGVYFARVAGRRGEGARIVRAP